VTSAKAIPAIGDGYDGPFAGTLRPGAAGRGETPGDRVVPCFTPGTMVTTRAGKRAVETLRPGDMLLTRDRGFQPVVWRGMRRVPGAALSPETAPVTIRAGALGPGQPERDMTVSPGHRMLSTDADLLRGVGEPEALVEARALAGLPGIGRGAGGPVGYVHLLMEKHEVILAENTWTESLRLTPTLLRALSAAGVDIGQRLARAGDRTAAMAQSPARHCLTVTEAAQGLRV
jgi:hypothetical protein